MDPLTPADLPAPLPLTVETVGPVLRAVCARLTLPLPGSGATFERWRQLAELSALDLTLGRLVEAHADGLAILTELTGPAGLAGATYGVWAAEPAGAGVRAERSGSGWELSGRKPWCSGAGVLDRALITAHADDGRRLFLLDTCDVELVPDTWSAVGMAASGSYTVTMGAAPAEPVGGPGGYLDRPGFWHGGAGVAACWFGGALGAARVLLAAARTREAGPHLLAHLGAVDALVAGMQAHLHLAAARIDGDPLGDGAQQRAMRVRARVEAAATEVLDRVGRALGAGPLCLDPVHAQRAADLPVYLRQSHAEKDLAALGELAAARADW